MAVIRHTRTFFKRRGIVAENNIRVNIRPLNSYMTEMVCIKTKCYITRCKITVIHTAATIKSTVFPGLDNGVDVRIGKCELVNRDKGAEYWSEAYKKQQIAYK